jgi:tetratricopeptide (TPR) repeat protein
VVLRSLVLGTLIAVSVPSGTGQSTAAAHRAHGLELGYNLDHAEALAAFREAIAADPDNPAGYRLAAATTWITVLFDQGAVTVEDYLGQARANITRPAPPPALDASFRKLLQQARALAERQLKARPKDADAHYQVGTTYSYEASYAATVEGKVRGSLGAAKRAFSEHERAIELDSSRKDAGLVVGLYRYAVSELSVPLRLFAFFAGFGGGRERGLRMVEEAARYPSDVQPNALFTLILLYNRESRFDDALRVIAQLQTRFPRNRLLWLEAGSTSLRAGRPAEARRWLEDGLARFEKDTRPRALGEDARWHFVYGATLVALKEVAPARAALDRALAGATRDWLRGRVRTQLGKLADLDGRRADALVQYRQAEALCRADHDHACVDEIKPLLKRPYR